MKRALALAAVAACSSGERPAAGRDATVVSAPREAVDARAGDDRRYRLALARGRELAQQGDAASAVTAFEEALAARPDDARALSELSWAAFIAGDLARAASAAERSVALAADPRLKAASLYNLGRAREEQGELAAALDAYRASLQLRPSRTVERRIAALASGSGWREAPSALPGPFAELADFCASLGLDRNDDDDAWCEPTLVSIPATLPPGFVELGQLRHAESAGSESRDLAVRTARGWYVLPDFAADGPWQESAIDRVEAAHGRLLLRSSTLQGRHGAYAAGYITVCGLGASGTPSCVGPVLIREASADEGDEPAPELEYTAELRAGDILAITPVKPDPANDLSGEHALVFP